MPGRRRSSSTWPICVQTWRSPCFPGQGNDSGCRSRSRSLETPSTCYHTALINLWCQALFTANENALQLLLIRVPPRPRPVYFFSLSLGVGALGLPCLPRSERGVSKGPTLRHATKWALQPAEKVFSLGGRGFSPGVKDLKPL